MHCISCRTGAPVDACVCRALSCSTEGTLSITRGGWIVWAIMGLRGLSAERQRHQPTLELPHCCPHQQAHRGGRCPQGPNGTCMTPPPL